MTRRSGVIAVLTTIIGALTGKTQTKSSAATSNPSLASTTSGIYLPLGPNTAFQFVEVVYGDRRVRLTPEQIMDALEGK